MGVMPTNVIYAEHVDPVEPKTKEMELHLQAGYGFSVAEAKELVKQREADPTSIPWDTYKAAQAMLAAYEAKPAVVSTRPGWKRQPSREEVLERARAAETRR